jgi:hypothetical protein
VEEFKLAVAEYRADTDAVMTARSLPALTGEGPSDLRCGGCEEIVAKGLNPASIAHAFDTDRRLLLKCLCGTYNLVREAKQDRDVRAEKPEAAN